MAASGDPYVAVKQDVDVEVAEVNALFEQFHNLLNSRSVVESKVEFDDFEWAMHELRSSLDSLETDLAELEDSLHVSLSNRIMLGLSEKEIISRKHYAEEIRRRVSRYRSELTSTRTLAKVNEFRRNSLASLRSTKAGPSERRIDMNFDMGPSVSPQQQMLMDEQDAELQSLGKTVGILGEMGEQMGEELQSQQHMLTDLHSGVDSAQTAIKKAQKKLTLFSKSHSHGIQVGVIIVLIFILAVVVVFAIGSFR